MKTSLSGLDLLATEAQSLLDKEGRHCLAIAGAPGSGKSTVAEALLTQLEKTHPGAASILPMDGFHYDDGVLKAMGRLAYKGAPDTFDVGGLKSVLKRLQGGQEEMVAVPVFDRSLEISRGSARLIGKEVRLIIVEGNYILLDQAPWSTLAPFFDITVMIDMAEAELRRRLRQRWKGFGLDDAVVDHKLEENDLPNGRLVMNGSRRADLIL